MPATPAVEVVHLHKSYGGRVVLDDLSFEVEPGEVFALLGPNGAGKTTTVEILEGYRAPERGEARVLGLDPRRDHRALRGRIGVMLQTGGLQPGLGAREAVRLFAAYYPAPADPDELLARVGLDGVARTTVRRLSGGEQQRLNLALALVGRPEVAFLDEPTAGMDPHARSTTWEVVDELRRTGATVVLTTHDMDEAEALADRVAIVDAGRLVASGSLDELTADAAAEETRFRAAPGLDTGRLAVALGVAPGQVGEAKAGEYRVAAAPTPELVASLTAWLRDEGVALGDLQATRRSLHEVFVTLTSEQTVAGGQGGS